MRKNSAAVKGLEVTNRPTTETERRKLTRDWLASCALERIYPDAATLAEFDQVDASNMTADDYLAYLNARYPAKT